METLIEVLGSKAEEYAFPNFAGLKPPGITTVRNHLLQHPEKHGRNFKQHLVVTDDGPVLKSSAVVIRGRTGRVDPDEGSPDQGLYVNARELREEILARF